MAITHGRLPSLVLAVFHSRLKILIREVFWWSSHPPFPTLKPSLCPFYRKKIRNKPPTPNLFPAMARQSQSRSVGSIPKLLLPAFCSSCRELAWLNPPAWVWISFLTGDVPGHVAVLLGDVRQGVPPTPTPRRTSPPPTRCLVPF